MLVTIKVADGPTSNKLVARLKSNYRKNGTLTHNTLQNLDVSENVIGDRTIINLFKAFTGLKRLYADNANLTVGGKDFIQRHFPSSEYSSEDLEDKNISLNNLIDKMLLRLEFLVDFKHSPKGSSVNSVIKSFTGHPNSLQQDLGKRLAQQYERILQEVMPVEHGEKNISMVDSSSISAKTSTVTPLRQLPSLPRDLIPLIWEYAGLSCERESKNKKQDIEIADVSDEEEITIDNSTSAKKKLLL